MTKARSQTIPASRMFRLRAPLSSVGGSCGKMIFASLCSPGEPYQAGQGAAEYSLVQLLTCHSSDARSNNHLKAYWCFQMF